MSFKVGKHGAAEAGGFNGAAPTSASSAGGDGRERFRVQGNVHPGLTSSRRVVLGSYNFAVSLVGLPSKDTPKVGIGRVREWLDSHRVRMKANQDSHRDRGKGSLWGVGHSSSTAVTR